VTANTIDCFKTRLDKFWNSQDVKFDYKLNLTALHNRSMINVCYFSTFLVNWA